MRLVPATSISTATNKGEEVFYSLNRGVQTIPPVVHSTITDPALFERLWRLSILGPTNFAPSLQHQLRRQDGA